MPVMEQKNTIGDLMKSERPNHNSRENVTIFSGEYIELGQVVGRITKALGSVLAGNNTGDGNVSNVSMGPDAKIGDYFLECVDTSVSPSKFKVVSPSGISLPDAEVDQGYENDQVNFSINSGETPFEEGDNFTIPIDRGSGKIKALDPADVDGCQNAAGISLDEYDAAEGDLPGVIVSMDSNIMQDQLIWPDNISSRQKEKALADLKKQGITFQ